MKRSATKVWKSESRLGKEIRLGIGLVELEGKLNGWEEDRRIMQNARGSRKEEIDKNLRTISGEGESAISEKGDSHLGGPELIQGQPETKNGLEGEGEIDFLEDSETDVRAAISNLGWRGAAEIPLLRKCRFRR